MNSAIYAAMIIAASSPLTASENSIPLDHPSSGLDTLAASVDGHKGIFLFDSGSGVTQLTPDFATTVGCTPWGKLTGFRARGDRLDSQRCNPVTIEVGRSKPETISEPAVADLRKMLGHTGDGLSGVVALDAFDGQTVTISLSKGAVIIESAASAKQIADRATPVLIRLVRDAQGAALTADMGVPTRLGMLWMEIDTGNPGPISVDKEAASLIGLDASKTGEQMLDTPLAGSARLQGPANVGSFIFDGNLGRGFLAQWDVTLDLAHGRGWITPSGR